MAQRVPIEVWKPSGDQGAPTWRTRRAGAEAENADLAAVMVKGNSTPQELTDVERYRCNLVMAAMFESHQTFFVQHDGGSDSPELWNYYSKVFDGICRAPGAMQSSGRFPVRGRNPSVGDCFGLARIRAA